MYVTATIDPTEYVELLDGERLHTNPDGTVTLITASGQEHTFDPDQIFKHED